MTIACADLRKIKTKAEPLKSESLKLHLDKGDSFSELSVHSGSWLLLPELALYHTTEQSVYFLGPWAGGKMPPMPAFVIFHVGQLNLFQIKCYFQRS